MPSRPPKHKPPRAGGRVAPDAEAEKARRAEYEAKRASRHERGYDSRWVRARAGFLRKHPICKTCESMGVITAATVVDHIIPHKGDKALFWQRDNWQPLCKPCHDKKTVKEGRWKRKDIGVK